MRKRLSLLLCTLLLVLGVNEYIGAAFTGGGAFGTIARYLGVINTNLLPSADDTYDLGSASKSWKDLHVDGDTRVNTLYVGGLTYFDRSIHFTVGDPKIIGLHSDGVLAITADDTITEGGNVRFYGNTHATKAQDIELYADMTLVLSWDESEDNWDFDGEDVIGMGTLDVGAITTTDDLTFSNANPRIIGGDTDGMLSVTGDTAINQGGNIRLYGNTHASLAQDIEFYADATLILSWDESEDNWDFDGEDVKGMGVLTLPSAGLHLLDTGADHDLIITYNENAGQDNTLNIILGDASRSLTLSGSYTFDQSVASGAAVNFGDLDADQVTFADAMLADGARGLSSIHTLSANPGKSDGIGFYAEGHIAGTVTTDGPTYGVGAWLNVDNGATLGADVRALDIGIYENGADCTGGNAYGLAIHMEFDDTNPPAAIYPFRINCNDTAGHATTTSTGGALIFAPNRSAIGLTDAAPGAADAYLKIRLQDGSVYRIMLVKE